MHPHRRIELRDADLHPGRALPPRRRQDRRGFQSPRRLQSASGRPAQFIEAQTWPLKPADALSPRRDMTTNMRKFTPELTSLLARLEARYCWDRDPATTTEPLRVIRRTMDFGDGEDLLDLERVADRALLVEALTTAPAGALRPRSWSYWHYRLRLTPTDQDPPPLPVRRFA